MKRFAPENNEIRTVKKFIIFPRNMKVNDGSRTCMRYLENVEYTQYYDAPFFKWVNMNWLDV